MSFIVGIFILLIVLFLYKFFQWYKAFNKIDEALEAKREENLKENNGLITYEELTQNLDEKFTCPNDIIYNIEDLKDIKVSKQRLSDFIKWLKVKNHKLLNVIKNNKSLIVQIPELSFDLILITRLDGVIKNPKFDNNFDAYNIQEWETYERSEISAQNLVKLFINKKIGRDVAYEIFEDGEWTSFEAEIMSDYYTSEDDLKIPEDVVTPGYDDYFEGNISGGSFSGPVADGEQILYCTVDVNYQDKEFNINGENFKFKEGEKDYLTTILMASYKPSLLRRVLKELENNENI